MALGVLGVLILIGATVSKLTTSGRWNTVLTSNEKRAEECAEAAANLMFKVVKDRMNDDSVFYNNLPFPANPLEILGSPYMYFRMPAFVTKAHLDGLSGFQSKGMDVQLDIFNNGLLKPVYERGIVYRYDSETDNAGPLSPLGDMFKSYGGKVSVKCTAKIKQAFGILADNPQYKTGGVEIPVKKATGFLSKLLDKILPSDADLSKITEPFEDNEAVKTDGGDIEFNLAQFIPDEPNFLKCPDISGVTVPGPNPFFDIPIPIPIGKFLQPFLEKVWDKIIEKITGSDGGVTPRFLAEKFFPNLVNIKLPFGGVINKLKDCVNKLLPKELRAFAGNIGFGVTVEKKGFLEVETDLEFYPHASDTSHVIRKKLLVQREFRVADIQPIAPDYTFFIANSKLPYENEQIENDDNWEGNECINWEEGYKDLVLYNFPDFEKIKDTIENIIHNFTNFKKLLRNIYLPGLVRVNYSSDEKEPMRIKLGLLPSFSDLSFENLLKCEILSLALGHKDGSKAACENKDHDKHHLIPGFKKLPAFKFLSNDNAFDWPYVGGSSGLGSYWIPTMPRFPRNCLFGPLHISMPMSFRVEGYIKKVYSHLKIHLLYLFIPPFTIPWPYFHFPGINISIPWLWATKYEEPYGFCKWPAYDSDSDGAKAWDPNNPSNLPANLYSTAQYLKKASYYYNSSAEFTRDIDNRSIMEGEDKVFVCDGVTFVNDSTLNIPEMNVKGRGIIVCAGNIKIMGNIKRRDYGEGIPSLFSLVARNGVMQISSNAQEVEACLYGDRGIQTSGSGVKIDGNLVVNRFKRGDMHGEVKVHYNSRNSRSSLLSMIRPIAKYEPTRYHVTLSSKMAKFEFVKPN